METKFNEATLNRPEGDRIIDAPFVFIDLNKYSQQLKEEEAWKKNDRNSITVYKTDGLTMVLCCLHKGSVIMDNVVGGLVSIQVMDGTIEFAVETGSVELMKQQLITVHPGIMHTIRALEDSLLLVSTRVDKDNAGVLRN